MFFKDIILEGENIVTKETSLSSIQQYFLNTTKDDAIVYKVTANIPSNEEGVLAFGISHINAGNVDGEFYMTKGHFHQNTTRSEYYWGIKGEGLLLLMDRDRNCIIEHVNEGSLHYIAGHLAHRLVNIGEDTLSVGACWSADSGYDYESIAQEGFSKRIFKDETQKYKIIQN